MTSAAVTICGQGMDDTVFRTAFLSKFLEFAQTRGRTRNISPLHADFLMYQKVTHGSVAEKPKLSLNQVEL